MGRITIFTAKDVHSKIIQNEFKCLSLPYTEISLIAFPSRHNDVKALVGKTSSMPQVFFNMLHVGGVTVTLQALRCWMMRPSCSSIVFPHDNQQSKKISHVPAAAAATTTPLEFFKAEIERMPDSNDMRLAPPPPLLDKPQDNGDTSSKRRSRLTIALPDGTRTTVLDIMEKLKLTLPQQELKYKDATYQNTFTGVQAVETFLHQMALLPEEAITFALFLFNANIFNYVPATDLKNSTFHNSDTEVYCLQCYRYPNVLNSYCIWNEPAGDATKLVARLDKMLNTLECNSLNEQGKMDYDRLMKLADFPKLEEAMCQLQTIDLEIFKNENE